jgi:thiol-disulfide isomerase/thioredoxin
MSSRLMIVFSLVAMMAGLATAQDKPASSRLKARINEALDSAEDDMPQAIATIEKALAKAPANDPDRRTGIYLIGAMAVARGKKAEDKVERIAMFHKGFAAMTKLEKTYGALSKKEKSYLFLSRIGEARALALEGKPDQSLAILKQEIDSGFDDFDGVELTADFDTVRILPEYKAAVAQAVQKAVVEEMASFQSFPLQVELKDVDDKTVTLDDYKGKVTIVDIWGTWCPPCRLELPHLVDLYNQYHTKGFEIVGVNCDEQGTPEEVKNTIKNVIKEEKIPFKCLVNDGSTEEKIAGFQGYPTTVYLDRTGRVRYAVSNYLPKAKIEAIIKILLAEPTAPSAAK